MDALGVEYRLSDDITVFKNIAGAKLNYSSEANDSNSFHVIPVNLLFENNLRDQKIEYFECETLSAFYKSSSSDFPFDIFAASFYLITRYEEYLPHQLDSYGRYAHENSLAFKEKFLHLPLVNLWLQEFKKALQQKFPELTFNPKPFTFIPTYDIDIAWSYLHKGFLRNVVGGLRSMAKKEWKNVKERIAVLLGNQKDPFDLFEWLDNLHKQHGLDAVYFFLLAEKQIGYDKNISPARKELKQLIKSQSEKYEVGIHPSWQSGDNVSELHAEIKKLNSITQIEVTSSRQHYIRMKFPETYRQLISAGIENDYSMGYGSINGFRASYCLPFKWYDLEKDEVTNLTIYPFCYMEANSYYEQHFTLQQAKEELENYIRITKQVDGTLITIMHNHLLGDERLFNGWKEMYEGCLDWD
jgi:cell fate (sporulation/competence/biofilm development) regulator YmcA (YheA/YmcA/DUF963 family)